MDDRALARLLGAGRVAVGAGLMLAPGRVALVLGPGAREPAAGWLTRAAGVRDLLLGVLTLRALDAKAPVRDLLLCGVLADGVDLGATLIAFRRLPRYGRLLLAGVAAGAVATGVRLASTLD